VKLQNYDSSRVFNNMITMTTQTLIYNFSNVMYPYSVACIGVVVDSQDSDLRPELDGNSPTNTIFFIKLEYSLCSVVD